ncbi:MFS transporter [Massilia agilis]|uniref:MFS transporter n=1 Tax=Massilia agilis TaxID=1811226 RepID=A0ABT2DED8_9BURK|nr:MFS transporter [Massilia agilis]MCS0809697.1 MFS transporter [Massilia agilis]
MDSPTQPPRLTGAAVFFCVFLPFALGHYLSCLMRNVNAVLAPWLVDSLRLTPGQLGLLTSALFFSFALVQLPVGIALDRYGPRRVQPALMLLAALGVLLFAAGRSFGDLVLARFIMGLGLGGCFMSAMKAIATWISAEKLPSINGYLIAAGGLGAATGTTPVRLALQFTDWRHLFLLLGGFIACAGLLILLLYPKAELPAKRSPPTLRSLLEVYRHPAFGEVASLVLVPHMVFFGIQGLWIGRWLSDAARFSDSAVAWLLYLGMAAVIFGAIGTGMITEWAARRGIKPLDVAACGVALFVLVQAVPIFNYAPSFQLVSTLFTLVGSITGIEYTIVAAAMPRELTGRASTCLNLLIFIGAFLVQAGFGQIIGAWQPGPLGHYPATAYRVAFGVLVLVQLPGLVRYFLRRRPVQCEAVLLATKEEYEIGTLRSSR